VTLTLLALASTLALAQDAAPDGGEAPAEAAPTEEAPAEEASAEAAGPRSYTLDPSQSRVFVLVRYDRNATIPGHDHVVAAQTFDGKVTWDPADPSACDVSIAFPVTALAVDPGNARSWAGLEGETGEGDKGKIRDNALGKHQLEASKFPTISYQSTSCTGTGTAFDVTGNLTIHGISKPITTKMTIEAGDTFSAKGSFETTHATWGMDPYSALLGALKNAPTLAFTVDVKGK
jgi:polyisoprenoid-binding protein YceI